MPPSCKQAYRVTATFLASLLLLSPAPGVAQSLGDLARQERERREKLRRHATRVLTNEDLAKPQILDPLDRVQAAAAPGQPEPLPPDLAVELPVAAPVSAESMGVGLPANVNLGDVARYYRLKKLLGEDALASRLRQTNAIPVAQQPVTAPAIDAAPMTPAVSGPPADHLAIAPGTPAGVVLGDVARSSSLQKSARFLSTARPKTAGAAPDVPLPSLHVAPPTSRTEAGVTPVDRVPAPSMPAASAPPIAPSAPAGAGIPPDVSLGDVARQLRQKEAHWTMLQPESTAPTPEEAPPTAAVMPESRATSALTVFSAPPPASKLANSPGNETRRLLRVVKLTEADILAATTLVEVKRGDSLWRIAAQHLGNGRRWKEIHARNPEIRNPHLIRIGDVIRVPHLTLAERRRDYNFLLVRAGDTLWALAALEFGRGEAWDCIARFNPQLRNPDVILPGQELVLPESCSQVL